MRYEPDRCRLLNFTKRPEYPKERYISLLGTPKANYPTTHIIGRRWDIPLL